MNDDGRVTHEYSAFLNANELLAARGVLMVDITSPLGTPPGGESMIERLGVGRGERDGVGRGVEREGRGRVS